METNNANVIVPFMAIHPTEIVKYEVEGRGMSQKELADRMGMQPSNLSRFLKGEDITLQMAQKLEKALGIPAQDWLNIQMTYERNLINIAKRDKEEDEAQKSLEEYRSRVYLRRIFLSVGKEEEFLTFREQLRILRETFAIETPDDLYATSGRFSSPDKSSLDPKAALTWTVIARYFASKQEVKGTFDKEDANVERELADVFNKNEGDVVGQVTEVLANHGIRFAVVKTIMKAKIDGFSYVGKDGVPGIVVTMRFNRIDNFAYAVMHELAHLKLHINDERRAFLSSSEYTESESRDEVEADKFASQALIPDSLWRKRPKVALSVSAIQREYGLWAEQHGLNRWLVFGRTAKELGAIRFRQDKLRPVCGVGK